jgi:precorrin-3B C17-methyltransferase
LQLHGKLFIVGIGPGLIDDMTVRAIDAIKRSDYVVGVDTYISQIVPLLTNQTVIQSPMGGEVERARRAVSLATERYTVSIISGGDPNVYGMASLVFELIASSRSDVDVEVIPGVTAVNAVGAVLGAPISSDYAVVSLSDLLTPWSEIERRLGNAAASGFIIALYNPRSRNRLSQFSRCVDILRKYRTDVPVGIVKNGLRHTQKVIITTLNSVMEYENIIDMKTTVIVGNEESYIWNGRILTPRGYHKKYEY